VRVLVDQCLPRHLATELTGHEATTVRAQRWLGLRNGVLLRAAVDAGFAVFGGGRFLVATTHAVDGSYEQNKEVLRRMVESVTVGI
jgi:hypothetical protein